MNSTIRYKQIYEITYPNGMIYVGSDLRGDMHYCGSPTGARQQIADDLGIELTDIPRYPLARERVITKRRDRIRIEIPHLNLVLRKRILWQSTSATDTEVRQLEMQFIRATGASNPVVGYNRTPKHRVPG